ncbi:riboflavin synthase [Nocardiopsis trehalosi]|uniref:riboflavin synthase n=1 Tax=Nocardiopsis trehalosi TaxID=109329 RepID=UPI0008375E56|nr:riboflavin synthase [Nocardiopsis trehalosi]
MFTGIVEELGEVVAVTPVGGPAGGAARITLHGPLVTSDAAHGDSIAVNGVCLTVTEAADGRFTADVMRETLDRSSLGDLTPGAPVNLERAARVDGRLGGHIVQGHVDGTGTVLDRTPGEHWETVRVALPPTLARYVVEKGSITVDGVSLTVAAVDDDAFTVALIPTTLAATTLGRAAPGTRVNLEVDVVAKYVERLLASRGAVA